MLDFTEIFDRHGLPLIRFARTRLSDPSLAEDVVHDVFLNMWKNRDSLKIVGSIESYLYQAVRHRISNVYREESRAILENDETFTSIPSPCETSHESDRAMLEREVVRALSTLSERCRQVFELHRLRERSYEEIAEILGIAEPTVRRHMARAVEVLREALKEWD